MYYTPAESRAGLCRRGNIASLVAILPDLLATKPSTELPRRGVLRNTGAYRAGKKAGVLELAGLR